MSNNDKIIKKYNLFFGAASSIDLDNAMNEAVVKELDYVFNKIDKLIHGYPELRRNNRRIVWLYFNKYEYTKKELLNRYRAK